MLTISTAASLDKVKYDPQKCCLLWIYSFIHSSKPTHPSTQNFSQKTVNLSCFQVSLTKSAILSRCVVNAAVEFLRYCPHRIGSDASFTGSVSTRDPTRIIFCASRKADDNRLSVHVSAVHVSAQNLFCFYRHSFLVWALE